MKSVAPAADPKAARRSPCGERGLKCHYAASFVPSAGRSPCGERGLKSALVRPCGITIPSLPVRGAWVEMPCEPRIVAGLMSLPVRGAWVEIFCAALSCVLAAGRSPCGERGLK